MTTKQIQLFLLALDYAPGEVDGTMGKQTKAAVLAFQKDWNKSRGQGLAEDGIAGTMTQDAIRQAIYDEWKKPGDVPQKVEGKTGTWWDDIRYFSRSDPYIGCPCGVCGGFPAEPAEKLMRLADAVRTTAGRPMVPTSTVRCTAHNAAVKGVWNSRHLLGHAMDFCIPGMTAKQILTIVGKQKGVVYMYAIDDNTVHMDIGN